MLAVMTYGMSSHGPGLPRCVLWTLPLPEGVFLLSLTCTDPNKGLKAVYYASVQSSCTAGVSFSLCTSLDL